jgi:hypothetical protein
MWLEGKQHDAKRALCRILADLPGGRVGGSDLGKNTRKIEEKKRKKKPE